MPPTGILLAVDPNNLQYNRVVNWDWAWSLGCMLYLWISGPFQVLQSYREERRVRAVAEPPSFHTLMAYDDVREAFTQFCERVLTFENWRFVREAKTLKYFWEERSESQRQNKARAIFKMFVVQNAPLQANLGSSNREAVEAAFRSGKVGPTVFDECVREAELLLERDVFRRFLVSKEYDKVMEERGPPQRRGSKFTSRLESRRGSKVERPGSRVDTRPGSRVDTRPGSRVERPSLSSTPSTPRTPPPPPGPPTPPAHLAISP